MSLRELQTTLSRLLSETIELDVWDQIVEATEGYSRICSLLENSEHLKEAETSVWQTASLLFTSFKCRSTRLRQHHTDKPPTIPDMKKLTAVIDSLSSFPPHLFPLDVTTFEGAAECRLPRPVEQRASNGLLLPAPSPLAGQQYLHIFIEKLGIKDSMKYKEPFLTIGVYDTDGRPVETPQDTPFSDRQRPFYIFFELNVHVQTPLESIPSGSAVFFEFKHFKAKKGRVSTRCYAFMEMDEVKKGPAALELYKKPTDFRRKKISLFSVKPLYLHLALTVTKG